MKILSLLTAVAAFFGLAEDEDSLMEEFYDEWEQAVMEGPLASDW